MLNFLFVGAQDKMEMQSTSRISNKRIGLLVLQRQINLKMLCFHEAIDSLWKSRLIINEFRPDVLLVQVGLPMDLITSCEHHACSYSGARTKFISRDYE
jgi:hypothetical protein